jgi:hypothetical protein
MIDVHMIKKLNKKLTFRISLIISSLVALFAGSTRDTAQNNKHVVEVLDVPLFSIEKAYASDGGGDCCGSSDGGITFPLPTSSGLGINFSAPAGGAYTCGGCGGSGCFVSGTKVSLADGSEKSIEDITTEDTVKTSSGDQSVMRLYTIPYTGNLYAFNGSQKYFVSPSHPFMTTAGWKSIDPAETAKETPELVVAKLEIGDEVMMEDGTTVKIESIESQAFETTVYNFDVNDSHDYYADGYHVHNVSMKLIKTAEAAPVSEK